MVMKEIALHILDIVQNSISAGAKLIITTAVADTKRDLLTVSVRDNGCGMSDELKMRVVDPFTTSRKTRKVGLGIPFFKEGALMCDGDFKLESELGVGTYIEASYKISHIDRPPLGDMAETMLSTVMCNQECDFVYRYAVDEAEFVFDTREIRAVLGKDIPFDIPDVMLWIAANLREGIEEVNQTINGGISI